MITDDFYPTPPELADELIYGIEKDWYVYDPSAGSGNLLQAMQRHGVDNRYYTEIEPKLSTICSMMATRIGDDFLQVRHEDVGFVDAIIMNPPFSEADKHINKAISIAPDGCQIRAICNAETIRNPYSEERRKLGELIQKYNGSVKYIEGAFSKAERKTNVEIAYIQLQKGIKERSYDFYTSQSVDDQEQPEGLVRHDEIRAIVNAYVSALKKYDEVMKVNSSMNALIRHIGGNYPSVQFRMIDSNNKGSYEQTYAEFEKGLQKTAWKQIFRKMNMDKYVTSDVMKKINAFIEKQQSQKFTITNVWEVIDTITGTYKENMEQAVESIFDTVTRLHGNYKEITGRGYKTNSHKTLNQKFILESEFEVDRFSNKFQLQVNSCYGRDSRIQDMNKALCFLTGQAWDEEKHRFDYSTKLDKTNTWYDFGFLEIKGFRKGTAHCRFKDEQVWRLFNERVAEIKGYSLPSNM